MMDRHKLGALFLQVLRLVAALAVMLAGTVLPLLFVVVADEAWELIPALGFAALCVLVAYLLVRPLLKVAKSS